MSQCQAMDAARWNQIKNIVYHLYIVKQKSLQGPDGVMKLMEEKHGFKASKAQYENYFRQWGFPYKNRKGDNYKTLNIKIESRKRKGKDTEVYENGRLIPRKKLAREISRHLTISEQLMQSQVTPPATPAGFQILTPSETAEPVNQLLLSNLPILRFQETVQGFIQSLNSFQPELSALGSLLPANACGDNNYHSRHSGIIESLLPNSALLEEPAASGLAIERFDRLNKVEFLNVVTFAISNNFLGQDGGKNIYKWLKEHSNTDVLHVLASMEGTTAKGLLEGLFRLAVEAGDTQTVKYLLSKAGINPNGHQCRHKLIPGSLSPLQFALFSGNSELALELISAGAEIQETYWEPDKDFLQRSVLVLAITGPHIRWSFRSLFADEENDGTIKEADEDGRVSHGETQYDGETPPQNNLSQDGSDSLLNLVAILIENGARINFEQGSRIVSESHFEDSRDALSDFFEAGHSPLTAASKYRHLGLVNLLIEKGADITFLTRRGSSALQECIYSCEEMWSNVKSSYFKGSGGLLMRLSDREESIFRGSSKTSKIICVVDALLNAEASLNYTNQYEFHKSCLDDVDDDDFDYEGYWDDYYDCVQYSSELSALDLSLYTECTELVETLLGRGATPTATTLGIAVAIGGPSSYRIFEHPDIAYLPIPSQVVRAASWNGADLVKKLVGISLIVQTRKDAIVEAIRHGDLTLMDELLYIPRGIYDDGEPLALIESSTELTDAIGDCCRLGHVEMLRRILHNGFKYRAEIVQSLGWTLGLIVSSFDYKDRPGQKDMVLDMLLAAGANVNARGFRGETVLLMAIRDVNNKAPTIEKLLRAGATLISTTGCPRLEHREFAGSVFVSAIRNGDSSIIECLMRAGADVNAPGRPHFGARECVCMTPLAAAVKSGKLGLIWYLVRKGAFFNNPPGLKLSTTPLAEAARRQNMNLIKFLLKHGANPEDEAALEAASSAMNLLTVLLEALKARRTAGGTAQNSSKIGSVVMARAISSGKSVEIVKALLESQLIDINALEEKTPYSYERTNALFEASRIADSPESELIMRLLLSAGADPNCITVTDDAHANTPLQQAVLCKNERKVQLLLEANANPNRKCTTRLGESALQLAVRWGNLSIIKMLLAKGADPDFASPSIDSGTPIQQAAKKGNLEIARLLLTSKARPDSKNGNTHTALQIASRNGNKAMVEMLIEYGADVNAPPVKRRGATALQFAAIRGFLGLSYLLLEHGAEVNAPPAKYHGRAALEGAAEHGRIDMVQLLINAGADLRMEQYGRAIELATQNGHRATRQLLESYAP